MNFHPSSNGVGLGIFSLILLITALTLNFVFSGSIVAALVGLLSVIMGVGAYMEEKRTRGAKILITAILLFAILATLFIIIRTATCKQEKAGKEIRDESVILKIQSEYIEKA